MATKNRTPEPTAPEMYAARRNDIARLLDILQNELDAHAPVPAQQSWGKVGDLGKVRSDLVNLVGFMGNMDPEQVEAFLRDE